MPTAKKTVQHRTSTPDKYTDPDLRERLKKQIIEGDKGGLAGQWSARKAQLLTAAYKKAGGGFKGKKDEAQESLTHWTEEHWQTADGKKAVRKDTTARYLPKKAWEDMTPAQRASTEKKKRAGAREGKQFVANTAVAKKARKKPAK